MTKPDPKWTIALPCSCSSVEHTMRLDCFVDADDKKTVYMVFAADAPGLLNRIKLCLRLLAGWRPCVFEIVLDKAEVDGLLMFLDQERGP